MFQAASFLYRCRLGEEVGVCDGGLGRVLCAFGFLLCVWGGGRVGVVYFFFFCFFFLIYEAEK